jgi:protein involved in ribonucleotide reduction
LSFEIYHPKNNVHNQDGNHDDNKVRITIFFLLTDNDGQNFLAGIVRGANGTLCSSFVETANTLAEAFALTYNLTLAANVYPVMGS